MAEIKFGTKQIKNPTPASLDRGIKVFMVFSSAFIAWMPTNNLVPTNVQNVITPILALMMTLALGIAPLFGIETDRKTAPMEDVTTMETPKE